MYTYAPFLYLFLGEDSVWCRLANKGQSKFVFEDYTQKKNVMETREKLNSYCGTVVEVESERVRKVYWSRERGRAGASILLRKTVGRKFLPRERRVVDSEVARRL